MVPVVILDNLDIFPTLRNITLRRNGPIKIWYALSEASFLTTLQYRYGRKKIETRRATQAPTPMTTPMV
jgi:hypothetical protein